MSKKDDQNPEETREWLDAMYSVIEEEGKDRTQLLVSSLSTRARHIGSTEG